MTSMHRFLSSQIGIWLECSRSVLLGFRVRHGELDRDLGEDTRDRRHSD